MPNREERRKAAKNATPEEELPKIKLKDPTTNKVYTIDFMELSGDDEQAFFAHTGFLINDFAEMMEAGRVPIFGVAGLLWLARRRREPGLAYKAVNSSITLGNLEDLLSVVDEDQTEPEAPPEG